MAVDFENTKNIILVFSKNYSYSLNLLFFVFFVFFQNKIKLENQVYSLCFSCFFRMKNNFKKT